MPSRITITFPFDAPLSSKDQVALYDFAEHLCRRHMDEHPTERAFVRAADAADDGQTFAVSCAVTSVSSTGAVLAVKLPVLDQENRT